MQKISDITDSNNLILFSYTLNSQSGATGFNKDQLCNIVTKVIYNVLIALAL